MKTVTPLKAETRRELFSASCASAANMTGSAVVRPEAIRLAQAAKNRLFDLWTAQRLASSASTSTFSR